MINNFIILLATSLVLFFIGLYGLASKDSGIKVIMSIEILVAAVNISFLAFGFAQYIDTADPQAQTFIILSLSVGGAVIGLAIAILLNLRRRYGTISLSKIHELRG